MLLVSWFRRVFRPFEDIDPLGDFLGDPLGDFLGDPLGDFLGDPLGDFLGDFLGDRAIY
tara:strand:- start:42 stop:218 length:177 start_codon:yes stop_codon:yes gene_type:complete